MHEHVLLAYFRQFHRICNLVDSKFEGPGVGSLTSIERPTWKRYAGDLLYKHNTSKTCVNEMRSLQCSAHFFQSILGNASFLKQLQSLPKVLEHLQ